jgi:hypothetical protein
VSILAIHSVLQLTLPTQSRESILSVRKLSSDLWLNADRTAKKQLLPGFGNFPGHYAQLTISGAG